MKYLVKMAQVKPQNQSRVSIQLTRILGQGARATINKLVKDGGILSAYWKMTQKPSLQLTETKRNSAKTLFTN